jgi:hypothetical protein
LAPLSGGQILGVSGAGNQLSPAAADSDHSGAKGKVFLEPMDGFMKKIFIVWKPFCTRSHNQAKHFGAKDIYISFFQHRPSLPVLAARYLFSFFATLGILKKEKANIIFSINQPPFCLLAIFLHTKLFGGIYILDSHSAAFNDKRWAWARPFYRFIARRAFLNINTNEDHKRLVESWGGRSVVIADVPIFHETKYPRFPVQENAIAVVASFAFDEPVAEIFQAGQLTPEVSYYLTGPEERLKPALRKNLPENFHLMGFLSQNDYFGLLSSVKGVLVLTTRENTMQRGAYEALSLEQPIITSDWEILRKSFGKAAVYVDNDSRSIALGVRRLLQEYQTYKVEVAAQRARRWEVFQSVREDILRRLASQAPP